MSVLPYRKVTWQPNDLITNDNLGQMSANDEYLQANTPRAKYSAFNITQTEGIVIVAGRAIITARNLSHGSVGVYFGNSFSSGCIPIITTGVVGTTFRIHVSVNGLGTAFFPTNVGFLARAFMDEPTAVNNIIKHNIIVNYIALGY